jgi:poly-gamma-glutamate capsule biosynthesis protein CapA/YwtB (metallophosphatase superfamily)
MTRRTLLSFLAAAPARETRLLFGGDVMLCRYIGHIAPFRDLAPVLSAADIAFVNLESPFSDHGKPVETGMVFKAEPAMIEHLKAAGIDIVSTANNHARDRGGYGIEFTLQWLADNCIASVGTAPTSALAHQGTVLVRNSVRFGFLAYAQDQANGNWKDLDDRICDMDIPRMQQDVASMKTRADVVLVSMHAGAEYWQRPHPIQVKFAKAAINAGAKVVVGHHPHVVQPWERYGNGVIFYSLGNLVFDQFERKETQRGLLAEVVFTGAEIARVNAIPVEILRGIPRVSEQR